MKQIEISSIELASNLSALEISLLCLRITKYFIDHLVETPNLHNRKYFSSIEAYYSTVGELLTGLTKFCKYGPSRINEKEMKLTLIRDNNSDKAIKFELLSTVINNELRTEIHPLIVIEFLNLLITECTYALVIKVDNEVMLLSKYVKHVNRTFVPLLNSCASLVITEPLDKPKYKLVFASVEVELKD